MEGRLFAKNARGRPRTDEEKMAAIKAWKEAHPDKHREHSRKSTLKWKYSNLEQVREANRQCAARIRARRYLKEALASMKDTGTLALYTPQRLQALESSDCWPDVVQYATQHSIDLNAPKFMKVH